MFECDEDEKLEDGRRSFMFYVAVLGKNQQPAGIVTYWEPLRRMGMNSQAEPWNQSVVRPGGPSKSVKLDCQEQHVTSELNPSEEKE